MPVNEPSHIYMKKANDDLISHCRCAEALITFPQQMDCPWCGCGWLFTCMECRKPFTFAEGVVVNESWEETAARELHGRWEEEPDKEEISKWVGAMKELLADVQVGEHYVYLDGLFVPSDVPGLLFDGWHSRHDLHFVPQVKALTDPSALDSTLGSRAYWQRNALPDDD